MSTIPTRLERDRSSEEGSALVSAVLILMLLTVLASGGYWVSRGEMSAAQGFSQSVRALYMAESGLALYFAANPTPNADSMVFEFYPDLCADTLVYTDSTAVAECYADADDEEEDLLEELELDPPPSQSFALTNANVYVTSDFVMSNGQTPIYRVRSEARVEDVEGAGLQTIRAIDTYAVLAPPFDITSVFAASGGVNFGGDDGHYHFDSKAKQGKNGGCGSELVLPNIQIPSGQFDLPLPDADCPAGENCPYKWHMKGDGLEVDSTAATGTGILAGMGIDWSDFLDNSYFAGVSDVIAFDDSVDFMDYFQSANADTFKGASSWPITRFTGDLTTDDRVKGYGLLIVNGDVLVSNDKLEWTGLILVGGTITTIGAAHIHVKGAAVAGLGCTETERSSGACRSVLDGDHSDMKYRPCEISQAWSRLSHLQPMSDLFREVSPEN